MQTNCQVVGNFLWKICSWNKKDNFSCKICNPVILWHNVRLIPKSTADGT